MILLARGPVRRLSMLWAPGPRGKAADRQGLRLEGELGPDPLLTPAAHLSARLSHAKHVDDAAGQGRGIAGRDKISIDAVAYHFRSTADRGGNHRHPRRERL